MLLCRVLVALSFGHLLCAGANLTWWQKGTIYQVYPRSFKDSDGDGIGDLKGITEKINYLQELGIGGFWISPIFKSPMADFGYDISNFTDIDPLFGDMNDFNNLLEVAHEKGLRVLLDFVPNHSSDEHPWFQASMDPSHPDFEKYKDYYVWSEGKMGENGTLPPNNWESIFGGSAWECNTKREGYCYLHQFAVKQPDLNYSNPDVLECMKDVLRFWLDKGVDGFRMDAVPFLQEDPQLRNNSILPSGSLSSEYTQNLPGTYDIIYQFRSVLDEYEDRVTITEAYGTLQQVLGYYGNGSKKGADFSFNFILIEKLNGSSTASEFKSVIDSWVNDVTTAGYWSNWVLGNHDQHRVASRFNPLLVDALNMLVTTLPGTAVTYNGEEIGMTDNTDITYEQGVDPQGCQAGPARFAERSRDLERSPFQWDSSACAGFSTNSTPWLPVNSNYKEINVEDEEKDPLSHLNIYKRMLQLRNDDVLQRGNLTTAAPSEEMLILNRKYEDRHIFVIINLGPKEETLNLDEEFENLPNDLTVEITSRNSSYEANDRINPKIIILQPHSGIVLRNQWTSDISTETPQTLPVVGEEDNQEKSGSCVSTITVAVILTWLFIVMV